MLQPFEKILFLFQLLLGGLYRQFYIVPQGELLRPPR